ncbi:MAG: cardiolipin synthase [Gemmatimonas sp.]
MTFADAGAAFYVSEWVVRLVMLVYVPQQRTAAATRTWLLFIFLMPWPGLIVYLLIGRIRVTQGQREKLARASRAIRQVEQAPREGGNIIGAAPAPYAAAASLAFATGDFLPFVGNRVALIDDYDGWITRLIADIDAAEKQVHLLMYIFEDDQTGQRVAGALMRAAARGVECRVLIDAVAGKRAFKRLVPSMRSAGVDARATMHNAGLFRRSTARIDLRNHRKLVIIDGRVGHVGSQNIVDATFVPGYPNEEVVARVTGSVVGQLEAVFYTDWFIETNEQPETSDIIPAHDAESTTTAQLLPSGPGYQLENARDVFIALLYAAQSRVVITTPYFVPDEPFLQALRAAAMRGVDVHLVVSKHANQPISQYAQRSYYQDILSVGVKVHLYRPRFLHAKHLTIDHQVAAIGTTNIDIRSFALNAEVSLLVYDPAVVADLVRIQERYFANSDLLEAERWNRRPLVAKVAQNLARLADSLL